MESTPDWVIGRHMDTTEDILDAVSRLLAPNHATYKKGGMNFANAPDLTILEDPMDHTVKVLVPLPVLHYSDHTVDDLEAILRPCIATGLKLEVKVHPADG